MSRTTFSDSRCAPVTFDSCRYAKQFLGSDGSTAFSSLVPRPSSVSGGVFSCSKRYCPGFERQRLISADATAKATSNSMPALHIPFGLSPAECCKLAGAGLRRTAYESDGEISDPDLGALSRGALALGTARRCLWQEASEAGRRRARRFRPCRDRYPDTARSDHRIQLFDG